MIKVHNGIIETNGNLDDILKELGGLMSSLSQKIGKDLNIGITKDSLLHSIEECGYMNELSDYIKCEIHHIQY